MKKLTVPGGSSYKQLTTTVMEECEEKAHCALWVIIRTVHNNNLRDHFDTNTVDCGRKT